MGIEVISVILIRIYLARAIDSYEVTSSILDRFIYPKEIYNRYPTPII